MPDTASVTQNRTAAPPAEPVAAEAQLLQWRQQFFQTRTVDVTVCIANWNCRDLLRKCLQSLCEQLHEVCCEVIVVDNASTDASADMVAEEFPQVQVIRNSANLGFARANNQAAARARGRYLFFLNNDTLLPAGTLARLVDYLQRHPEVGMIGPRLRDGEGKVQASFRPQPTVWSLLHRTTLLRWTGLFRQAYLKFRRIETAGESPRAVEVLMGAAVMLPRALFVSVGGWDESFAFGGEDMELCCRVRQQAPIRHVPGIEITHFGRASTRQNIAFAAPRIAVGYVRCLRKTASASETALFFYKLFVTVDAPVQVVVKTVQYLARRLRGQRAKADKSLLAARSACHFLVHGLIPFWRA